MIGGALRDRLGALARRRRTGETGEETPAAREKAPIGRASEATPREAAAPSPSGASEATPQPAAATSWSGASEAFAAEAAKEPARPRRSRIANPAVREGNLEAEHPRTHEYAGVEDYLPGGEWRDERGAVFVHERLRSQIERARPDWGRLGVPPETEPELVALRSLGLERVLFLDLETGGLASSPVFLAGTMHWNGEDFVLRQYFARHYGEEAALLRAVDRQASAFETLVTFNGRSYDAPFLRGRALVHGVALSLPPCHLDLLHAARRRWRDQLADCRLQTLERHVCHRRRSGDVPSDEVPGLYHDFVRRGDAYRLVPVFHHNLLDVITMAEILRALCTPGATPARPRVSRRRRIAAEPAW